MIPKRAVKAFIQRARTDYRAYKKLTDEQLQELYDELPTKPPIWKKLSRHQKVCFIIGVKLHRFMYLLDMGMGKTLLSIALVRYFRKSGIKKPCLVLVPNKTNCQEWADEVAKHSPSSRIAILAGSSDRKWELLHQTKATFVVTTYDGFARMLCKPVPITKGKRKGKRKLKLMLAWVKKIAVLIDGLVMDESTDVAYKTSLPFRVCRQLTKHVQYAFALTGTPFGRDPMPVWGQVFMLDRGHTLGETLGLFRAAFYSESDNYWGGKIYKFKRTRKALLHRFLANVSIRYKAKEGDLPALRCIVRRMKLPVEATQYYEQAKQQVINAKGNFREMKNAFLRMRQISSGFVGFHDDDTGKKAKFEFSPNPKLESQIDLCKHLPPGSKIVVFHDFIYSGDMLARELTKQKIRFARVSGATKDPQAELTTFKTDPLCRVFVVNSAAGARGLNLQVASYYSFFESPVPVITRKQAERRVRRQHSEHETVFQYDMVMKGTADERIIAMHREGEDLFQAIVEGRVAV